MDFTASLVLLSCIICACLYLRRNIKRSRSSSRRPPGPFRFPIIGNILQLGNKPHQSLAKLSQTHGPLMHLKLGSLDAIVVSSPELAKEVLQHGFSGRMTSAATTALDHHLSSIACLPAGDQWRILRKICRERMFSTQGLDSGLELRRRKLQELRDYVGKCCGDRRAVDIGEAAFVTTMNLMSNTLFSVDFADYEEGSCRELKMSILGLMAVFGRPNVADYFPIVGWFDPQGIKREAEIHMGKLLGIFDGIIDERERGIGKKNDFLEALMEISEGDHLEFSRNDIKHLLLDLFVAGIDTTSSTVEWAMTELLRNPDTLSKAKQELQIIIGQNKQVEESDISNLPFLQAVIKENFRRHPPGPFLTRGNDENDVEINGYVMPRNAVVLVNIWAMGRDSRIWRNPDWFDPERFLHGVKGQSFDLLPFGAGRRVCPGVPLAYRMVHLMVAYLIHNFDWKVDEIRLEEVEMDDNFGLSLHKAFPLMALPIKL